MKHYLFLFFLIFSLCLKSFAEDFTEVSILVFDKNKIPIENVNISIGDLAIKTDSQGLAKTFLFPANYEIEVSKLNYFKINSSIEPSSTNNQFVFYLESMFTDINLKVTDALSGGAVASSVKITDLKSGESSFSSTNNSGDMVVTLKKDEEYLFEINEKSYKAFSFKIDTSKLLSSSFLFKLERLESNVNFKLNVKKGKLSVKLSENGITYSELDFNSDEVSLLIPYGQYDIEISSDNYEKLVSSINFSKQFEEHEFNLKANFKNFKFFPALAEKEDLAFISDFESLSNEEFARKSSLKIYQGESLIKTLNFSQEIVDLDLNYGVYHFELSNVSADTYTINNVSLQEDTPEYILIKVKKLFATLSGTVQAGDALLGGVKVVFEDKDELSYSAVSSIDGSFSIKLPPREYNFSIEKDGYRLVKSQKNIIDFLELNGVYDFNIQLEEIPSQITGKITNLSGKVIDKARITLKVGKDENTVFTNSNGEYEAFVKSGLVFIKVDKPGHKSKGTVKSINRFSTLTNINFQLEQIFSSIDGVLTDGSSALEGIKIRVLDLQKNIIASSISKNDGVFKLENLPILEKFTIVINQEGYMNYESDLLTLNEKPVNDFNIILAKDSASIIVELKNENQDPLINEEVVIGNKNLRTDINGILETEIKFQDNDFYIAIEVPKYDFKDRVKISKNMASPLRKEITLKEKVPEPEPILELKETEEIKKEEVQGEKSTKNENSTIQKTEEKDLVSEPKTKNTEVKQDENTKEIDINKKASENINQ